MGEHQFDQAFGSASGPGDDRCYDYGEMLDELRCHTSEWLEVARTEAVAEQRWWRLRELAVTAVLPDQMVERLRADAKVEPVLTDEAGEPILVGRTESVLSEKTKRVVRQRDGHCRYPGCDRRIGLHVHHLWPASWGGSDEIWNLATVCTHHHAQLAPQGRLLLLGNPNHPAGLTLVDRDDLAALAVLAADRARAAPDAA